MSSHFVGDVVTEDNDLLSAVANAAWIGAKGDSVGKAIEKGLGKHFWNGMTRDRVKYISTWVRWA